MIELKLNHKTLHISIPETFTGDIKLLNGGHPLKFVQSTKGATIKYLNCVAELMTGLPKGMRVQEFCGGIGLFPLTLWDILEPSSWEGVELDPECAKFYQCPQAKFVQGDMYDESIVYSKDLIMIDNPTNTLPKMWREPQRAAFYKRVFASNPRYVEITDVGYWWIHLANHWPIYQERFGVQVTRQNYHELFDRFCRDNYGYTVIKWTVGGGAQYFLLEKA